MFSAGLGGTVQLRRKDPLIWPLEEIAVCRGCIAVVVLAGDVQGEIDEGLAAGFDEGGEAVGAAYLMLVEVAGSCAIGVDIRGVISLV